MALYYYLSEIEDWENVCTFGAGGALRPTTHNLIFGLMA